MLQCLGFSSLSFDLIRFQLIDIFDYLIIVMLELTLPLIFQQHSVIHSLGCGQFVLYIHSVGFLE